MINPDWVCIYTTNQSYDAEIIKTVFEDNGIECVLVNKQDSAYMFGEIELYVPTPSSFLAKQLIVEFRGE
jgi:hypothetical protein